MRKIVRFLFTFYHLIFPSQVAVCRFRPTCSEYSLKAIESYGLLAGTILSIRRIASCHPFSRRTFYDPLPSDGEDLKE